MANSIIEQSARNSTFVLKLNNIEWDNFSTLFQLIAQLKSSIQADKRDDTMIKQLLTDCDHYYQSLKLTVIDKVKRFSPPCAQLLCFDKASWITLNQYFVISCCIADFLSQCEKKPPHVPMRLIQDYLKRFKRLEERVYTILHRLV